MYILLLKKFKIRTKLFQSKGFFRSDILLSQRGRRKG